MFRGWTFCTYFAQQKEKPYFKKPYNVRTKTKLTKEKTASATLSPLGTWK